MPLARAHTPSLQTGNFSWATPSWKFIQNLLILADKKCLDSQPVTSPINNALLWDCKRNARCFFVRARLLIWSSRPPDRPAVFSHSLSKRTYICRLSFGQSKLAQREKNIYCPLWKCHPWKRGHDAAREFSKGLRRLRAVKSYYFILRHKSRKVMSARERDAAC